MQKYLYQSLTFSFYTLLSLFLTVQAAHAATYYVTANGSDAAGGTSQQSAFRTITKGASILKPGDTLLVGPGTYAENLEDAIPSGTSWSAPVMLQSLDAANPPVVMPSSGDFVLQFTTGQYIIIDGFILDGKNINFDTVKITYSGNRTTAANHIRIVNSEIRNGHGQGILVGDSDSQYNEFVNDYIHDNGTDHQLDHGMYIHTSFNLIDSCIVVNNAAYGIQVYDEETPGNAHDNIISNNRVFSNRSKGGIVVAFGANNIVENNFVYQNGGDGGIKVYSTATNIKIYNNTIVDNSGPGIYSENPSGQSIINNIIYKNSSVGVAGTNSFTADPKFINESSGDLHLQAKSPAIDKGTSLTDVATDIDYGTRPNGAAYDIGADEYGVVGVNPYGTNPYFSGAGATPTIPPTPTTAPYPQPGDFDFTAMFLLVLIIFPVAALVFDR